jgi:hypothetical protein
LDHLIIPGENHLRRILREDARYYNESLPHLSLEKNAPVPRSVEPSEPGAVVAVPRVGGCIIFVPEQPAPLFTLTDGHDSHATGASGLGPVHPHRRTY